MTKVYRLRTVVIGLIAFSASEEEMLLTAFARSRAQEGTPQCWAAKPLVAHNAEFRQQLVQRFDAVRRGETPPHFAGVDHDSAQLYGRYSALSGEAVARACRETALALIDAVSAASERDLTDPSANPWLDGRQLWLKTVVRGFWHPTGHLGEYFLSHDKADHALALQRRAVGFCAYLGAPAEARAMAFYNLGCAQARSARLAEALEALREAIGLSPQLSVNARRDPDLDRLREGGRLDALLGLQQAQ